MAISAVSWSRISPISIDVGVVTQDAAQAGRERQADLGVHLNLADARLLVFDRVFDGDDLDASSSLISLRARVERGRLAGAGRAGDQHDAVRQVDQLAGTSCTCRGSMPTLARLNTMRRLVEETHDDAFAVDHRDDRDADVDLAAVDAHLDAAVLRQALLGDVEPGHDLEAADDGRLEAVDLRRQGLRLQHAVDAVADAQVVFFAARCGCRWRARWRLR